jgi:hypothetical protein
MTQQEKPQRVQIDWVELFGAIDIESQSCATASRWPF